MLSTFVRSSVRIRARLALPATTQWTRSKRTAASPSDLVKKQTPSDPEEHKYHSTVVNGRGSLTPFRHPQTHGIPVAQIHFRSYFPPLLALFTHFASHAAASLGIPISGVASLPTQRSMWTVPRGPFVHKKSQENFERLVHKRAIKAFDADQEVVDRWVKYMERHAMPGVGMRIVRWHRLPVGVGKKRMDLMVEQMMPNHLTTKQEVEAVGQQIVKEEMQSVEGSSATLPVIQRSS